MRQTIVTFLKELQTGGGMLEEATTRKKSSDSIDVAVPYYHAVAGNRQASERKQEPCTTQLRVEEGAKGSTDPPSGICGQCWMYIVVFCLPFQCPYKPILGCAPVEEMWPSLAGAGHGGGQGQSRDCHSEWRDQADMHIQSEAQ